MSLLSEKQYTIYSALARLIQLELVMVCATLSFARQADIGDSAKDQHYAICAAMHNRTCLVPYQGTGEFMSISLLMNRSMHFRSRSEGNGKRVHRSSAEPVAGRGHINLGVVSSRATDARLEPGPFKFP